MSIKTLIIEDEEKSVYVLKELISQFAADFSLCGIASHVSNAVQLIETTLPDLVFMDIRIGDGTGFDVLKRLSSRSFEVIFITAYDSYAVEAFRVAAVDYLLKPIGIQEFEEAAERAKRRLAERTMRNSIDALLYRLSIANEQHKKLSIPTVQGYEFVDIKDIVWCRSEGSYTTFYLANGVRIVSSQRLGLYEDLLCANNFFRIHHSIVINMQFIKSYIKGKGGYVVMADGTELEVSQRKRREFLDRLMV